MVNANLLRARIKELGMTQKEVAVASGISGNSLSRKLNGKRDFRLCEIERLCKTLGIDNPNRIFFDLKVPNAQQIGQD